MTGILRVPRRAALAAIAAHAHVTVAPGCVVPVPVLVLGAGLALCTAAAWLAVRLARGFRSSPAWRSGRAAGDGSRAGSAGGLPRVCPLCSTEPGGGAR
jgi:hypothetical protein